MKFNRSLLSLLVIGLSIGGCASNSEKENALKSSELAEREKALDAKEAKLNQTSMKTPSLADLDAELLPPNAKPGECYARLWADPIYETLSEKKRVKDQSEIIKTSPATYDCGTQSVLVSEASSRLVPVVATYGTEKETIKVSDASQVWHVNLSPSSAPVNKYVLDAAKKGNIDLVKATPGMCFHEHYHPARYETKTERVLVKQKSNKVTTTAAKYRVVDKKVLVKEASFRLVPVKAVYQTMSEKIVDKPEHTTWKKGKGLIQKIDESTGEIMCLVTVPATYKTVVKSVLKSPATTKKVEIPAVYKMVKVKEEVNEPKDNSTDIPEKYQTVTKEVKVTDASFLWHEVHNLEEPKRTRTGNKICLIETPAKYKTVTRTVVKTPATSRSIAIPAVYKDIKDCKVATAASEKRTVIPATYKEFTKKRLVKEGHMEWRSVLCDTNMTRARIRDIQLALRSKGFEPGRVDGDIGSQTMSAVNAFQRANKLPVDKYLNIATVEALGVSPR